MLLLDHTHDRAGLLLRHPGGDQVVMHSHRAQYHAGTIQDPHPPKKAPMPTPISPDQLRDRMSADAPYALIDVRDIGEYNASHIPGASLIPRARLEFDLPTAVPQPDTPLILCDDDARRVVRAAATAEAMGYRDIAWLQGGVNRWASLDLPTEWGVNVPSKDFGERVEVVHHVPEITADDLHARIDRGDQLVILDTRTPEEYQRFCIPGGRSLPGGELALRITDTLADAPPNATVVINCAGRTRSIIGTRALQRMALDREIVGLKNGTSGWLLAGYDLEEGADRTAMPNVTEHGRAAAEAYARRCAAEDGVQLINLNQLDALRERAARESVYFIDVRSAQEHAAGRIPGFRWFPGGQAVQRSDDVAVVHHAPIVFACDRIARAAITASWYKQMGHAEIYALEGGITVWAEAGRELTDAPDPEPALLTAARNTVTTITPRELARQTKVTALYVGDSQNFAHAHPPGAHWTPRAWLEWRIEELAPNRDQLVVTICRDGNESLLAAATLRDLGYGDPRALEGGTDAWRTASLPIEQGLAGILSPPHDTLPFGPDRNYADMQHYLRWETALGEKYAT